jgi:hypothetical protein
MDFMEGNKSQTFYIFTNNITNNVVDVNLDISVYSLNIILANQVCNEHEVKPRVLHPSDSSNIKVSIELGSRFQHT